MINTRIFLSKTFLSLIVIFLYGISVFIPLYSEHKSYDKFMQQGDVLFAQGKFVESKELYLKAIKNRPEAAYKIGELYFKGLGIKKDIKVAHHFYSLAANQGYQLAIIRINKLCEKNILQELNIGCNG